MAKKATTGSMLVLLLASMLTLALNIQSARGMPTTWIVDDDGPADFQTIQQAIDAAGHGDTIVVHNGTYYENLLVNKPLSVLGESRNATIVDGNGGAPAFYITSNYVNISGFTSRNSEFSSMKGFRASYCNISNNIVTESGIGILLDSSSAHNIVSNNIVVNNTQGLHSYGYDLYGRPFDNRWVENTVAFNKQFGIALSSHDGCSFDLVLNNTIMKNKWGIRFCCENGVLVSGNTFVENDWSFYLDYAEEKCLHGGNTIYHNNFWDDSNFYPWIYGYVHVWDDDYPSGGNYWSNYHGEDNYNGPNQDQLGSDGIGDTPYILDTSNIDRYPLMEPWPPTAKAITAEIDIDPDTLNIASNGQWIASYIEIPNGYDVRDIVLSSIKLNGTIAIDSTAPVQIGDYDSDSIADLMVKFDRETVIRWLCVADYAEETARSYIVEFVIEGTIADKTLLGTCAVRLLKK